MPNWFFFNDIYDGEFLRIDNRESTKHHHEAEKGFHVDSKMNKLDALPHQLCELISSLEVEWKVD
jgi:hypothetical protein